MSTTSTESKEKSKEPSPAPEASSSTPVSSEVAEPAPATETPAESASAEQPPTAWQAIFSPQYNAYYFFNSVTQETTWTNPLVPSEPAAETASTSAVPATEAETSTAASGTAESSSIPRYAALQNAAIAQGIDPALAYLDPSLVASTSTGDPSGLPSFQAKFNARTGQFAAMDSRTPAHLSEYERAKRMSEVFFDVAAWEQNLAQEHAAEAEAGEKKRKRPSKKDLERFKQQKKQKKIAKTAWLRT
ncbi:hypothetical protein C8F04DRAFT_1212079 [Mycena alexandri]|uniref:WW domain-containing protein n=1 Tax=Mycena alexandri TaxID=1745969 RepID=A0AAD6SJH8_9AGAR|nr:hypothetical protein C8F04DRAFT_1212079 [Mycena alexandri]